jgi:hypothetical protein
MAGEWGGYDTIEEWQASLLEIFDTEVIIEESGGVTTFTVNELPGVLFDGRTSKVATVLTADLARPESAAVQGALHEALRAAASPFSATLDEANEAVTNLFNLDPEPDDPAFLAAKDSLADWYGISPSQFEQLNADRMSRFVSHIDGLVANYRSCGHASAWDNDADIARFLVPKFLSGYALPEGVASTGPGPEFKVGGCAP